MTHGNFTEADVAKASAIINIFETDKPLGRYDAVTVLDDGAGVSFGIKQFTHASGSLMAVVGLYLKLGGTVGEGVLRKRLPLLSRTSVAAIATLAADKEFAMALRQAAATTEMRAAQDEIAYNKYLKPAIDECAKRSFALPLSLAVVCDSFVHGSFRAISRRIDGRGLEEKRWITAYVRERDAWLRSIPRLRKTAYRTRFFLDAIATRNWMLELPVTVNGRSLHARELPLNIIHTQDLPARRSAEASIPSTDGASTSPQSELPAGRDEAALANTAVPAEPIRGDALDRLEARVNAIAARVDQADRVFETARTRTDRAKSLWTTIGGSLWQALWALAGIAAGMPREVWFVTAVIAGALTLLFLYRQITLGRVRETRARQ